MKHELFGRMPKRKLVDVTLFKRFRVCLLQTQSIRERAVVQLQRWISEAEKAAGQAADPDLKREWLRLGGFLHQILNSLLKTYDEVMLDEGLKEAEKVLNELKEWKEQLEVERMELEQLRANLERKESELKAMEEELKRLQEQLEAQMQPSPAKTSG